jgi:hypothetical protein
VSFNPAVDDYEYYDDNYEEDCGFPCCGCPGNEVCSSVLNSGLCPECSSEYVQVQNGDWVCPDCDLWL